MINKWILNNFKSIGVHEELEFRPLTIFTGANSSGKSTVLQSILLVTQTLQSPIDSRSIVLNGGIKKFGSYSDIVNQREFKKDLTVGFDITDDLIGHKRFYAPWLDDVKQVRCRFVVGSKVKDNLQPDLKQLDIECADGKNRGASTKIKQRNRLVGKLKELVEADKLQWCEEMRYDVKVKMDDGFSNVRVEGRLSNNVGAAFTHFLPNYVVSYYNKIDRVCHRLFDMLEPGMPLKFYGIDPEDLDYVSEAISPLVIDLIEEIKSQLDSISPASRRTGIKERCDQCIADGDFEMMLDTVFYAGRYNGQIRQYGKRLKEAVKKLEPSYSVDRSISHFIPGVDFIKEFFCNHIWYLGPLREEPKALYPLESDGSMHDVGYKGENTAAVFDYNRNEKIEYVAPSAFCDLKDVRLEKTKGSLESAVKEWLVYLGVANDITTDDRGKIGHTMQISNDARIKQDLTHVGVGVSQVLPILVMSLLAEKGDVIILEQPELHLHPKVQTRLADFFVSMNALGKQCLIETHSEYMINRLRYLVAISSEESTVAKNTKIYFVEKEKGQSNYRPVVINKYGVIDEWPDGFFDENEKMALEILKAGMKKKNQEDEDYEE